MWKTKVQKYGYRKNINKKRIAFTKKQQKELQADYRHI